MTAFQRRLDILDYVPRYPKKVTTRRLLQLLEQNGHGHLLMRTVQRDLEAIEKLGVFGLEVDKRSKPYGWSINLNWKKLNISLMDANSALAFSTLKQVAENLLPESTLHDLSAYFDKAETILENEQTSLVSHWRKSVALITEQNPVTLPLPDKDALSQIKQALFHKQQISAELKRYLIANKPPIWKRYTKINPLGIIQRDNVTTLVCSIGSFHRKIYKFPIAFIKNISVEKQPVVKPQGYDFEQVKQSYFATNTSCEIITLQLIAKRDSYFVLSNGKLSENQSIEESERPDSVLITAQVADTPKLRAFLRGLGNSIEVVAPASVRNYFKALAQDLLLKYTDHKAD